MKELVIITILLFKHSAVMNILYYYAQRMPSKEVDFRKTSGSGKVLNYLIQHSLESSGIEEKDILKKTKLKRIVSDINKQIESLNSITGDKELVHILIQRQIKLFTPGCYLRTWR